MRASQAPSLLRSVRRRPAAATVLALLALLATVASIIGPLLLRAVEQASLDDALARAGVAGTSVAASAEIEYQHLSDAQGAVVATTSSIGDTRPWHEGVVVAESAVPVSFRAPGTSGGASARTVQLAGLSNDCRQLGLRSGRCPSGADEVLAAAGSGITTGMRLATTLLDVPERQIDLRVVGTYDATTRVGSTVASPGRMFGSGGTGDPDLVLSLGGFDSLSISGTMWSVRTLRPGLTLDAVPTVVRGVAQTRDGTLTASGASSSVSVEEHIDALVDRVADGNDAASVIVAVAVLQAVVLAWFAQGVVAGRVGQARAAEWGLARLRGLPARRRLVAVLLEPVVATLLGSVVGAVAGVGLATVAVTLLLGDDAPPLEPLRAPVLVAFTASVAGSLVALVIASARASRVPLVDLLRRVTEPRTLSRAGAVVQAVAVIAAVVGLAAVVTQADITGPGVALLAPSLVAVLLAVVGLRIGVAVVRRPVQRPTRSLTELLVVRRIARTPSVLTTAVMVVLGVALAVSTCQIAVLGVRLAHDRAAASLGAAQVLTVRMRSGDSLQQAVRVADPTGRTAMAVATTTSGTGVGRLIAVDTDRLAAVSAWDPAWGGRDVATLRRLLHPATGPSLEIRGTTLGVTLDGVGGPDGTAAQDVAAAAPEDVDLVAVVQATDGWHRVDLGAPVDGTHTSAAGAVPCADGCRLVWLGLSSHAADGAPYGLAATITAIDVDGSPVARRWLDPGAWRNRIGENALAEGGPSATLGARADGLRVSWVDPTGQGTPAIAPRDAPEPLPAVVGSATALQPFAGIDHAAVGLGLNGESLLLRVRGTAPALPRFLDDGALVDIDTAARVTDLGHAERLEVWLAPGTHPDVVRSLTEHGVVVTGRQSLVDADRRAVRAAPVLGALVGVPTAGVALVLTLLVVAGVAAIGARARRVDLAVLRTAGFGPRAVRRAVLMETFLPALAASVLGAVAGTAATLLTASRLPLRAEAVPPLGVPVGPATVCVVLVTTVVVVFGISAAVAAAATRNRGPE